MNITLVFDGLQIGGIERVGVDYVNLLSARGHNVSVVNLMPELNALYHQLPKSCKVYEFKLPRWMVPYRYAKVIEKGLSGALAYFCVGVILSVVNIGRKVLAKSMFRDFKATDVVIAFSGHFNDLMFVASGYIPGIKMAWLHGSEFEYKVISDGYFILYRKIKNLVCLSELCDITCRKFNEENGIRKERIYNPIMIQNKEVNQEKVVDLKNKYGKFVIMVGRLALDKDQKTAILAVKHLNSHRLQPTHLLLAGDGENRSALELFVKEQNAEEFIHFLGNCLDIQNYYAAAHVFVHSSAMEGLPTVLLEAMSYGVPIAATDSIPGVREIIGDSGCGLISPVEDWKTLGMNIERLIDDSSLREKCISAGKERVKNFIPELAVIKLERYIESLQ